jgi:Domain of unknown function (DUF4321)
MSAKNAGWVVLFILVGAILGGYVGELLGLLIPAGFFHDLFVKSFDVGLDTMVLDLRIVVLTLGFKIYINLCSIIGMIAGFYYSR